MRTIETNIYTISDHPNTTLCFDWIRANWHDLNQSSVDEMIDSLKALRDAVGGELDCSISQAPDRGEFVKLTDFDPEALSALDLSARRVKLDAAGRAEGCPLTGHWTDYSVIQALRSGNLASILDEIHSETEAVYSDEGLRELCEANGYEFTEGGTFYPGSPLAALPTP